VGTRGKPFKPADCQVILREARDNLMRAIEESGAVITQEPLPKVLGDEVQLLQLFQNLVANAIKFRGQVSPRIRVSAQQSGPEWIFAIQDNGIGIAPEHQKRIFSIFQRLHHRSEYPGTGIGLALCKKIVERHGGRIWVESQPGQGSTFYFSISGENSNDGD
jgi:light-regulated signal transduction histidine kinase (bacteriophytochrome)